jgi:hypothetical protein
VQVPPLNEKDLKDLLNQPLIAKVATTAKTGDLRMSPVWFGDEGGSLLMNTFENSELVRNLRGNPKCSLMVDSPEWPYIGVHYWGSATVEGPEDDVEGIAKLFTPYRGGLDSAREYAKVLISWGTRVYVRFRPQRSTTWDFRQ